ncbi:hypothetical protein EVAR_2390_1 [Eumeta japonica]|uniref:Gustatory receptor n=1 Tax=Eumeta variegata TaxID=151549 RepID=A0A4C1SQX2_EUMVA|nr:hypothetical protein EVAR_2390_1 [Eumeta japonica]
MENSFSKLKVLENLASDRLEDNFVKCFWPMHVIQMSLGSSRVDLINKYATQPTACQKIYTILWIFATVGSTLYLTNHFYITYHDDNISLYYILSTAGYMQSIPSILNLIHVRFFNGSENVELYVTMQKIDRAIGLDYIKTLNWRLFKFNLSYAFLITFVYLTIIMTVIYIKMKNPMFTIFLGFSIVSNYMETALQEYLMYFLATRLRCVNETLKAHLVRNRRCQCSEDATDKDLHAILCDGDDYLIAPEINECFDCSMPSESAVKPFKLALKSFKIINKTFNFQVLLMIVNICVWVLLIIDALVVGERTKRAPPTEPKRMAQDPYPSVILKEKNMGCRTSAVRWHITDNALIRGFTFQFVPLKGTASLSVWMLLNLIHVTAQSVAVELFLSQLKTTKRLCIRILSLYYEGPLHVTAKRLLTVLEAAASRFSVYDMFALDKRLPLKIVGLITTYVLLLMQFTLL